MAHTFADEIVLFLTSKRGIAMTSIAFYSDRDGSKEIYLMDYDGHDQRRLTAHKSISMSPSWSGPGDAVAYVSFFGGTGPAIYLADVASGRKSPLVTEGSLNACPRSRPTGGRCLRAQPSAPTSRSSRQPRRPEVRRLTNSGGIDTNPGLSSVGREIAFTSSRSGSPQIYVMDAEGANVRRVTSRASTTTARAEARRHAAHLRHARRRNRFDIAPGRPGLARRAPPDPGGGTNEAPSPPDGRRIASLPRAGGMQIRHGDRRQRLEQLTSPARLDPGLVGYCAGRRAFGVHGARRR
jgi:TolB protein